MAGPKHLWSGDWEHESTQAADERLARTPAPEPPDSQEPQEPRRRRRRISPRELVLLLGALVIVGVAVAVVSGQGATPKRRPPASRTTTTLTTPTQGQSGGIALTQPSAPSRVANEPRANWLGMQIVSSPLGAVVSTVAPKSVGEQAGLDPGDVITAVDNHAINSAPGLRTAVRNVALGQRIEITIERGSSLVTAAATLKDRPTIQP